LPKVTGDFARFADSILQMSGLYNQEVHVLGELGESIAVSVEKAKNELGYKPEIELEEGMRRSIEWCRSVGVNI
jgi:nucleoside-diphosphate-sugar epimerase